MKGCSTSNLVGAVIPNRPCLISKTLQRVLRSLGEGESSARFTETERRRAPSSIAFILTLLLASPCLAWDDDELDAPSRSTRYNSSIYSTSTKSLLQNEDLYSPKQPIQPQQAYEVSRTRALHVDTIQEANEKRALKNEELMAECQRSFERQEAQQEKSRAQMAKQQSIYDEMDQEECEMAEFLGGVYKAKFGATTGRNSAVTTEGYVFRSGNNFVTPRGIYTKTGNTYAGPASFTTQTGTLFFGNNPTTIQAGGAYFSEGESGYIVSPNCRNTSTWRSR
jgi:hypothetical protein